jgi:hypothetical protein
MLLDQGCSSRPPRRRRALHPGHQGHAAAGVARRRDGQDPARVVAAGVGLLDIDLYDALAVTSVVSGAGPALAFTIPATRSTSRSIGSTRRAS